MTIAIHPVAPAPADPVDHLLKIGLKDLWYPICPSGFIKESPVSLRRLGRKFALWRDHGGKLHALEDRCPHRGAPLSQGVILGDRLSCPYHGVEVRCDGVAVRGTERALLRCPWHKWDFDIASGRCVVHPTLRIRRYRVTVGEAEAVVELAHPER